ncbi:MAG: signal peptidase I [Bacteroidales bacterium]|nr:signal peptidase I [Bacteroidales bacterium]
MRKVYKNVIYVFKLIVIAVLLAVCLRTFFFASYKIPSYSMLPAITGGDYILVNKWIPGPRLFKKLHFADGEKVETKRLPGLRSIRRNDVLVFNFPYKETRDRMVFDRNMYYVKRCVAIPGDTFYIEKGVYKVKNNPDTLGSYRNQADNWIRFNKESSDPADESFPFDPAYPWNILDFGPLYIPGKGDRLSLDNTNIKLYEKLIAYETFKDISVRDGNVYIGDERVSSYTFENNYYFMTGDYVFDSQDSRYWGLLPEDHIVGKAGLIWQSREPGTDKFRWDRFLKRIT